MLGQRRRRWANIKPALVQHLVFALLITGIDNKHYGAYALDQLSKPAISKMYKSYENQD